MTGSGLLPYCDEQLFIPALAARERDQVLVEMVDRLVASGKVRAREVILHTVRERERIWPTAIGKGVAIPHGRSLVVPELTIVFGRTATGIDFGAEDGDPVRLVFLILAPYHDKENRYLPALGKVVELVADDATREKLLNLTQWSEFAALLGAE
ncbi:MAG TPA: PTS sugar transporter subunit IIA [Candidatus Udaeobacter sp.]|nr:PTS sugar transporter subunit IIA [Candidatus Udaeobacter sp.]